MSDLNEADLKLVEERLKAIEDKLGSKWTVPILVAVISGLIGMVTVVMQARLERDRIESVAAREEASKRLDAKIADGEKTFSQMHELAAEVRKSFRSQCQMANVDQQKLDDTLANLHDFATEIRVKYGDEETATSLLSYGDWVSETLYFDPVRTGCAQPDTQKYETVAKALQNFYTKRCTRPE